MKQRNCHLRHSQALAHIPVKRQIYAILNPCENTEIHTYGSLPCCDGMVADPVIQVEQIQRLLSKLTEGENRAIQSTQQ